jgi:hypothetical protein
LGSAVGDLFRPGYNLFLVGVFNAVPFAALAGLSRSDAFYSPILITWGTESRSTP